MYENFKYKYDLTAGGRRLWTSESMEIACPMSSQLRLHYLYKNLIMLQQDNPLDNTYSIIRV